MMTISILQFLPFSFIIIAFRLKKPKRKLEKTPQCKTQIGLLNEASIQGSHFTGRNGKQDRITRYLWVQTQTWQAMNSLCMNKSTENPVPSLCDPFSLVQTDNVFSNTLGMCFPSQHRWKSALCHTMVSLFLKRCWFPYQQSQPIDTGIWPADSWPDCTD